jgi:REP element-mobilizing transposase RayT
LKNRKSIRLKNWDYSSNGVYFITICTKNRKCLFGEIINGEMNLNELGNIAKDELSKTLDIRPNYKIIEYIIMPNHIHFILTINHPTGVLQNCTGVLQNCTGVLQYAPAITTFKSPKNNLGSFIRGYKSSVTNKIKRLSNDREIILWQRNYYEHIIRDDKSFENITNYIKNNPINWEKHNKNEIDAKITRFEI